ncbi:MAG: fimbrillin family protein [Candidatus Cryptobacteroides sp.]
MMREVVPYMIVFLALAASCSLIEEKGPQDVGAVCYNVVESDAPMSKSASVFPTTETFISSAYSLDASLDWDTYSSSSSLQFGPEEVKYQGTYWSTDEKHYWQEGKLFTFFSYAPASLQSLGIVIDRTGVRTDSGWDVTSESQKDRLILVADIAKDKSRNEAFAGYTGVPTHFRHKLSKITLRIAESDISDADGIYLTRLSLKGYWTKGDFSKGGTSSEAWTNLSDKEPEMVIFEDADGVLLTSDFWTRDLVMIPQTLDDGAVLSVSYKAVKDGGETSEGPVELSFVKDFRSGIWTKGTWVTYTLKIGAGLFPILFDASSGEWKYSDGGIIEIE